MNRKVILVLSVITILASFSSCIVSKQYVQHISKKEEMVTPQTKKVLVFATDDIKVSEFKKTFDKNYADKSDFTTAYVNDFAQKSKINNLFSDVFIDADSRTYETLNKNNADYIIYFSNLEISNRYEMVQSAGGMGPNGMGMQTSTSVEYCVITVKVEIYDAKTAKEILDFVVIGEESVFLFDFTKTFLKAKERSIDHIINYLQSGKTEYKKY